MARGGSSWRNVVPVVALVASLVVIFLLPGQGVAAAGSGALSHAPTGLGPGGRTAPPSSESVPRASPRSMPAPDPHLPGFLSGRNLPFPPFLSPTRSGHSESLSPFSLAGLPAGTSGVDTAMLGPSCLYAFSVAIDTSNGDVYFACYQTENVLVLSGTNGSVVNNFFLGFVDIGIAYDSSNNELYVADATNNTVAVVNPATGSVVTSIGVGSFPVSVTWDQGGYLYVSNDESSSVSVIDTVTSQVVATITTGQGPAFSAYDPTNHDIYVPCIGSTNVSVISDTSQSLVASVPVSASTFDAAYAPSSGEVYVTAPGSPAKVNVINPSTNSLVKTIAISGVPYEVAYDAVTQSVLVSNINSVNVSIISTATNAITGNVNATGPTLSIVFDGGNGNLYLTGGTFLSVNADILILSGATYAILKVLNVFPEPAWAAYDDINGYLYVDDYMAAEVTVFSVATDRVVATIPVGTDPYGLVYDSSNERVYVANEGSDNVSVLNGTSVVATLTLPPGYAPTSFAYDSASGYLFVTSNTDTLTVISGTNDRILGSIPLSCSSSGATYDPANGNLYVAGCNTLTEVSGSTFQMLSTLSLKSNAENLVYYPGNGDLYVALGTGLVQVVSTATFRVVANVSVGSSPYGLSYDESSGLLFVASSGTDNVSAISTATNSLRNTVLVGQAPVGVITVGGSGETYVVNAYSDSLSYFAGEGPQAYPVHFVEKGLPSGTYWNVCLNTNIYCEGLTGNMTLWLPNGSYAYSVSSPIQVGNTFYTASPSSGTVTVSGTGLTLPITFSLGTYVVTITESGLPSSTRWDPCLSTYQLVGSCGRSISVGQETWNATNGTYYFTVGNSSTVSGSTETVYVPSPASGTITVNGHSMSQTVTFTVGGHYSVSNITFNETGLPAGGWWWVCQNLPSGGTVCGSVVAGTNHTVSNLTNGTYHFSFRSLTAGYAPTPASANITTTGLPVHMTVTFKPVPISIKYSITFNESGLPPSTAWEVCVDGAWQTSTTSSISVTEGNGTHGYLVEVLKGYAPVPSSGSVVVKGTSVSVSITYGPFASSVFAVTFGESGLPSGTFWSVTFNGATQSGTGNIVFTEPNGSYPFSVGAISGYSSSPSSGAIKVNGTAVSQSVTFTALPPGQYSLIFTESGLPTGTIWSVTLGTTTNSSAASSIPFAEANGTYHFTVGSVTGYTASPSQGNVTVNGASQTVAIAFAKSTGATYPVTFTESGLLSGTSWSVTFDGTTQSSTTTSIVFSNYLNNTYAYSVGVVSGYNATPSSGSVTINGASKTVPITFTESGTGTTYSVTFSESGLPSGTSWSVTLNGITKTGTGSIVFIELNGSYLFSVGAIAGYSASPSSGTIKVNGNAVPQSITFTALPPGQYSLIFSESGLPGGTNWSVTLAGQTASSTSSTIAYSAPNGTYSFTVNPVLGYTASPSLGNVNINGASKTISVNFTKSSTTTFTVTFSESGLPAGTSWSVTLNGSTQTGTGNLVFTEPNGSYPFFVGAISGYSASPSSGTIKVSSIAVSQSITFTALPPGQYSLIFSETGLPAGANWSVTLSGKTMSVTGSTLTFTEKNGTYNYTVTAPTGYTASPSSGSLTVAGKAVSQSVTFTKSSSKATYTVTFTESGLPSGTSWSVTLNGSAQSSTTGTITFQEANGSYSFSVGTVSGYTVNPTTGTVKVSGGPTSQSVAFTSTSSKGKTNQTTGFLGLPGDDGYIVIGGVLAAVAIATAVLLMRGRGKRPAPVSSSKEEPERTDNKGNAPSDNVHFNRDNPNVPSD